MMIEPDPPVLVHTVETHIHIHTHSIHIYSISKIFTLIPMSISIDRTSQTRNGDEAELKRNPSKYFVL